MIKCIRLKINNLIRYIFSSDWLAFLSIIVLAVGLQYMMYEAYKGMHLKKEELEKEGYKCQRGREASGPSHSRDTMYYCYKGDHSLTVGIFGKPVSGKYVLHN